MFSIFRKEEYGEPLHYKQFEDMKRMRDMAAEQARLIQSGQQPKAQQQAQAHAQAHNQTHNQGQGQVHSAGPSQQASQSAAQPPNMNTNAAIQSTNVMASQPNTTKEVCVSVVFPRNRCSANFFLHSRRLNSNPRHLTQVLNPKDLH